MCEVNFKGTKTQKKNTTTTKNKYTMWLYICLNTKETMVDHFCKM